VIGDPPLDDGATHVTVAWALPGAATTPVGDPGSVAGVTDADALEGELVPIAFFAVTVNVYAVPFVSPVTVAVKAPVVVAVLLPGDDVTV